MPVLDCSRCGKSAPAMERPPLPGTLGRTIHARVCALCWKEWQQMQVRVINENRLNLAEPESRRILQDNLRLFLHLPSD